MQTVESGYRHTLKSTETLLSTKSVEENIK